MKLTSHLYLLRKLIMSAVPPIPQHAFMMCTGPTLTLTNRCMYKHTYTGMHITSENEAVSANSGSAALCDRDTDTVTCCPQCYHCRQTVAPQHCAAVTLTPSPAAHNAIIVGRRTGSTVLMQWRHTSFVSQTKRSQINLNFHVDGMAQSV